MLVDACWCLLAEHFELLSFCVSWLTALVPRRWNWSASSRCSHKTESAGLGLTSRWRGFFKLIHRHLGGNLGQVHWVTVKSSKKDRLMMWKMFNAPSGEYMRTSMYNNIHNYRNQCEQKHSKIFKLTKMCSTAQVLFSFFFNWADQVNEAGNALRRESPGDLARRHQRCLSGWSVRPTEMAETETNSSAICFQVENKTEGQTKKT